MKYKAKNGLNYPDAAGKEKRIEVGTIVEDLPDKSVPWLLKAGEIEEVHDAAPAATPAPAPAKPA